MKKLLGTFALAGFIGLTACDTRDDSVIIEDDPLFEQPATAPVVTEPAPAPMPPMTTDTMMLEQDTLAPGLSPTTTPGTTAPGATTPGTTNP